MKIAIFETSHFELTYTLISLYDQPGNQITIFVHPEAYRQLLFLTKDKAHHYTWFVKKETESNRHFIRRMFQYASGKKFDFLFFSTIADNFIIYAYYLYKQDVSPSILTLHDVNGYFQYKPSLSLRRFVRYIGKRLLMKRFYQFNVLSETIRVYLKNKLSPEKKVFSIPGNHFVPGETKLTEFIAGEPIRLVIPGSIDERRRDYSIVKQLLDNAHLENIKIEICLLGPFTANHSKTIRDFCLGYKSNYPNLKFFDDRVIDQPVFDKYMEQSHFVLIPVYSETIINDGITEKYGKSICSGNIGDVIKYAKPFFIRKMIPIDDTLLGSVTFFETTKEIMDVIRSLTHSQYQDMCRGALRSSRHYSIEEIISRNKEIFQVS